MTDSIASCPNWLSGRLIDRKGPISFYEYMDWVLNDPEHGFYSTGRLQIGEKGDFCTSPSLTEDFGRLLAIQVVEWLIELEKTEKNTELFALVEIGPGEGNLSRDLMKSLLEIAPNLISKVEFILVEPNLGMKKRQEKVVNIFEGVNFRWCTLEELTLNPVKGVVIANEVLDVFPVERLIFRNNKVHRQGVSLKQRSDGNFLEFVDLELTDEIREFLNNAENILGINFPPKDIFGEWITEWHCDISNWFEKISQILITGPLLIIDYALESRRYYSATRNCGTLLAYRNQKANPNLLRDAGCWDLTSHICIEATIFYAIKNGWRFIGETRQGQALLALGLSKLLYSIQELSKKNLSIALNRRESLLRLVDPMGLGEFRWLVFQKVYSERSILKCRSLKEPLTNTI